MDLKGKAAVVTGSSRGAGRATAIALAKQGCSVLINYNSAKDAGDEVAEVVKSHGVDAVVFGGNVADDARCREMMKTAHEAFGRLDILVNNAGTTEFVKHDDLEGATDELWDNIWAVNVKGPFQCIRAARDYLVASGDACVVNVASVAGISGTGSSVPYCASKAALINLGTTMARALGPEIRVNTVSPGFIAGDWLKSGLGENYEKQKAAIAARATLEKVSEPEDVADAILCFITGSGLVTGQNIVCDGGSLLGPRMR